MQFTLSGHITPEDKARSDYKTIPFDLPRPARWLYVSYRYSDRIGADQTEGGNVIDIGIFDPRGADFPGGAGFRGWSGSDRLEFSISTEIATPGYFPGPLPAGHYQILLGLYRIWPKGADYQIQVEVELEPGVEIPSIVQEEHMLQPSAQTQGRAQPAMPSLWLQGDLQTHTDHSDGKGSPELLTAKARSIGLDFLAITDHNTVSAHALFPALATDDLVLIPGQEVTTYYGHMNVWGTSRWVDFRCRTDVEMAAVIDLAHGSGGFCSINHPRSGDLAWYYSFDLPVDSFEIWNGPWPNHNVENLALWHELLKTGRRIPIVGGSDYHCPSGEEVGFVRLGQPTTWVNAAERSAAGILASILAGRSCVSAYPHGPRLELFASTSSASAKMGGLLPLTPGESADVKVEVIEGAGFVLRVISEVGVIDETRITASPATVQLEARAERFLRAELAGDLPSDRLPPNAASGLDLREWRLAISNPIYIDKSPQA